MRSELRAVVQVLINAVADFRLIGVQVPTFLRAEELVCRPAAEGVVPPEGAGACGFRQRVPPSAVLTSQRTRPFTEEVMNASCARHTHEEPASLGVTSPASGSQEAFSLSGLGFRV